MSVDDLCGGRHACTNLSNYLEEQLGEAKVVLSKTRGSYSKADLVEYINKSASGFRRYYCKFKCEQKDGCTYAERLNNE